jgi:uncharacterized protein
VISDLGRSAWFDLPVADLADAMAFYEGLLGWNYKQMENSPLADYAMIDVGGELIGGLRKMPPSTLPKNEIPILYFTVEHLADKVARAKELGAEIVGATVELGKERGRYQWIRDRAGNLIGLWARQ